MFNFTTTNVINSLKDTATNKDLLSLVTVGSDVELRVKRIGNFKKSNVEAIYKAAHVPAQNAQITITVDDIKNNFSEGDQLRLNLYVGLTQASQDSRYSNDMYFKGKPFAIEFVKLSSDADTLKNLEKTIKKYSLFLYGDNQLLSEINDSGSLVISATNEFQRFKLASIEKYEEKADAYPYSGKFKPVVDLLAKDDYKEGVESFGTYAYILHNLRLPTSQHFGAFAVDAEEMPVIGRNYNQYTIRMCVERGVLGMHAVGQKATSVTNHVFYVATDLSENFEKFLAGIHEIVEVKADGSDFENSNPEGSASDKDHKTATVTANTPTTDKKATK